MGLPLLLIWFLIIPLVLLITLAKNEENLNLDVYKVRYAFLYRGYTVKRYYWEFIVLLRKYFMIILILTADL